MHAIRRTLAGVHRAPTVHLGSRTVLERSTDRLTGRCFDLVVKDVAAHPPIVAPPRDYPRPSESTPEPPATQWKPPPRPRNLPRDNSRKRPQKRLKIFPPSCPHEQMHMRPDIGKVVDPNAASSRASPKGFAHRSFVPPQGPFAFCPVTLQRHVHRVPRAHRTLYLPPRRPLVPAVACASKRGFHPPREKVELHRPPEMISRCSSSGQC
jgi:hypothetical protein